MTLVQKPLRLEEIERPSHNDRAHKAPSHHLADHICFKKEEERPSHTPQAANRPQDAEKKEEQKMKESIKMIRQPS
jgi:hypothetical protein